MGTPAHCQPRNYLGQTFLEISKLKQDPLVAAIHFSLMKRSPMLLPLAMTIGLLSFFFGDAIPGGLSGVVAFGLGFCGTLLLALVLAVLSTVASGRKETISSQEHFDATLKTARRALELQKAMRNNTGAITTSAEIEEDGLTVHIRLSEPSQ